MRASTPAPMYGMVPATLDAARSTGTPATYKDIRARLGDSKAASTFRRRRGGVCR